MDLQDACTTAIELTRDLHEALQGEDLALCEALLVRRADAMVVFEDRHRAAGDAERASCRDLLIELQEKDRLLQDKAAEVFALAGRAFHAQMGAQPVGAGGYGA
jgi:hypothetical protein